MKQAALILCLVPMVLCGVRSRGTPPVKESTNERRNLNYTSDSTKQQENMQRYITHLHRQEPSDSDTMTQYIRAYNEQPQAKEEQISDHVSLKNHEEFPFNKSENNTLPNPPVHVIRFELSDAAVPSKETEELISKGRARSLEFQSAKPQNQAREPKPAAPRQKSTPNNPNRTQRRKATPRSSTHKPSSDMATQESRMVQIIHPMPHPKMTNHETNGARHAKSLHEFPSEVQDIINSVLLKEAHQYTPNALYKDQSSDSQRYGLSKNNGVPPKDFSHQQFWKQQLQKASKNRLILRPVADYGPNHYFPNKGHNFYPPLKEASLSHIDPSHITLQDNTNHIPTNFKIEVPDEPVKTEETPTFHVYNSAYTSVDLTNEFQYADDANSIQPRPQDSRAPILFPPGARQTLPKSNTTVAILKQFHQPGPTPIGPNEYYYPPSIYKPIVNEIKPYHTKPIIYQTAVPFYYPKDHKPITEIPAEGDKHEVILHEKSPPTVEAPVYKPMGHGHSHHIPPTSYTHFQSGHQHGQDLHQYASGYAFGYRVRDFHTGNDFGHTQNRDPDGVTRGEYHILLPDGRLQSVKYTADDNGFHADVSYDEHGAGGASASKPSASSSGGASPDAAGSASGVSYASVGYGLGANGQRSTAR